MRENIFNYIGNGSTITTIILGVCGWVVESNINIILATIVSALAIIYWIIKIIDFLIDLKLKWGKRRLILKKKQLKNK